jgi:hypothetical protein
MIQIPFNHKPYERNVRKTRDEILLCLPKAGDVGHITTDDYIEAKRIENFLRSWSSPSFSWKRDDSLYMRVSFILTKHHDTPTPDFSDYVEVPPHPQEQTP